ncbi:unnamed protein product [Brugia timori]|uniref:Uncharacterized protein n=1 Tax=Brugia timori TaxID=42155 RepID=A0A3P7YMK5_9BILA|nr:unnamed protein product [Brugia timori]
MNYPINGIFHVKLDMRKNVLNNRIFIISEFLKRIITRRMIQREKLLLQYHQMMVGIHSTVH